MGPWWYSSTYHGTIGTMGTMVRTRVLIGTMVHTLTLYLYHGNTRVRTRVRTMVATIHVCCTYVLPWYVSTHVRTVGTYVLKMLCHNFLIGKGHTCALRSTYVPW
jgi:hypothetical protein